MTSSFQYSRGGILLDINNVSVSYGNVPIIKNFTAQIHDIFRPGKVQGQIIGLLGPSGIGKTTIFKVIAGLLKPDSGTVTLGPDMRTVLPGDVGVVAQHYPLLEHRTIKGNLAFAARQAGNLTQNADTIAKQYINDFGLAGHDTKYPHQLSGGQRQRVAIAQQLICSKYYIVMDEPFSGLDVVALSTARSLIQSIADRHEENTFIIVTHDVTSALAISDTIWLMGRDRDISNNVIPGARIMETIDLIEQDICWHDDPTSTPQGINLIKYIKNRFLTL